MTCWYTSGGWAPRMTWLDFESIFALSCASETILTIHFSAAIRSMPARWVRRHEGGKRALWAVSRAPREYEGLREAVSTAECVSSRALAGGREDRVCGSRAACAKLLREGAEVDPLVDAAVALEEVEARVLDKVALGVAEEEVGVERRRARRQPLLRALKVCAAVEVVQKGRDLRVRVGWRKCLGSV